MFLDGCSALVAEELSAFRFAELGATTSGSKRASNDTRLRLGRLLTVIGIHKLAFGAYFEISVLVSNDGKVPFSVFLGNRVSAGSATAISVLILWHVGILRGW